MSDLVVTAYLVFFLVVHFYVIPRDERREKTAFDEWDPPDPDCPADLTLNPPPRGFKKSAKWAEYERLYGPNWPEYGVKPRRIDRPNTRPHR